MKTTIKTAAKGDRLQVVKMHHGATLELYTEGTIERITLFFSREEVAQLVAALAQVPE